jgi:hypothetical protein
MANDEEELFESADAGASHTEPTSAGLRLQGLMRILKEGEGGLSMH